MDIVVYGNSYQSEYYEGLHEFFESLGAEGGVSLLFEESYGRYIESLTGLVFRGFSLDFLRDFRADLVLSVGGDGTFLHTASEVVPRQLPIMGINTGHLGYLSATRLSDGKSLAAAIKVGSYVVEDRIMLEAATSRGGGKESNIGSALNEVVVQRADRAMIEVSAFLDGKYLASYLGDGLIIATATGSTAYNLSAGGPILAPDAPSWVLTPVAPHSLTMRPLVVNYDTRIHLKIKSRSGRYMLSIDGQSKVVEADVEIELGRAPYVTKLVRLEGSTFIDRLRSKLLWGVSPGEEK